ncbi:GNAT family N-acetyltransferase [Gracilibacillus salinarum]|uniref:GNAT family N-acetyltransferase n=1 Tax=Gracilibacillus salinarum TaxID=2932255 RepID=A0ABY4GJ57_9BACI|nr:GNAT family N-acetyltransferase [Gracilibacillus salinarum]UOQ84388.1 GNAT family N-acetyltransferase [Gracilibacillus salinarum]
MEADKEDLEEFLDPQKRGNTTYAVLNNNELIGFLSAKQTDDLTVEIGLGLRPELTGRGYGEAFLKTSIAFLRSKLNPEKINLSVATFNQRAIKVYKKIGFKELNIFMQETNGDTYEFLKMELDC